MHMDMRVTKILHMHIEFVKSIDEGSYFEKQIAAEFATKVNAKQERDAVLQKLLWFQRDSELRLVG